jgi:ABC-type branched-subunit amino acid transport system substrate-binding protein
MDDQYTAPQALANARSFAQNNDVAILGGCGTTPTVAIGPYANSAGIPFLFPLASSATTLVDPFEKYTYVLYPFGNQQFGALVRAALTKSGKERVYLVNLETNGANTITTEIQNATVKSGGTYAGTDYVPPTSAQFSADALKIKAAHSTYLVVDLGLSQSGALIKALEAQEALPSKYVLTFSSNFEGDVLQALGTGVDSMLRGSTPTPPPSSSAASSCVSVLDSAKTVVNDYSIWGCAEAQVLITALNQIHGAITRDAIVEVLNTWTDVRASPVLPPITFTPTNHEGATAIYEVGVKIGSLQVLGTLPLGS